jgi:orotate phosphoribosyltransferase
MICLDRILQEGEKSDIYVKVKKRIEKELLNTGCERILEKMIKDFSLEVPLPYKHITSLYEIEFILSCLR